MRLRFWASVNLFTLALFVEAFVYAPQWKIYKRGECLQKCITHIMSIIK